MANSSFYFIILQPPVGRYTYIPCLLKNMRQHSITMIVNRMTKGMATIIRNPMKSLDCSIARTGASYSPPRSMGWWFVVAVLFAVKVVWRQKQGRNTYNRKENWMHFAILMFIVLVLIESIQLHKGQSFRKSPSFASHEKMLSRDSKLTVDPSNVLLTSFHMSLQKQ